uniref:Uncharacterized protein n=1 Tax=Plectus sambesii TaxID=2011161 RepID=A0A914VYM4_9BILA
MATNMTQRLKKEKKHVRFADTVTYQKDADVSIENTRVVNISDDQNEQIDAVVHQLDKLQLEALRCMDVHCEANEWRLNAYNVRADSFDRLLQIVPALSATVELDHAQVHLQTLFNEMVTKWQMKMGQIKTQLDKFTDKSSCQTNVPDINSANLTAIVSSPLSNRETSAVAI